MANLLLYLFSTMIFFIMMLWPTMLFIVTSSPTSALFFFMGVVISSMYLFFFFLGDFLSFLIFLVYVGGLLVLLIYMVMISSNVTYGSGMPSLLFGLVMFLWLLSILTDPDKVASSPITHLNMPFDYSLLTLLGLFLFFVFVYMCNIVSVGGRSMNIGNIP